jgi:hypothetical protein
VKKVSCRENLAWLKRSDSCVIALAAKPANDGWDFPSSWTVNRKLQAEREPAKRLLPLLRTFFVLFAGLGIFAFFISAISPQDDDVQQESFCGRALFRAVNKTTGEMSVPEIATHGSYAIGFIRQNPAQPDAIAGLLLCVTAVRLSTIHHANECSGRAPPHLT